MTEFPTTPIPPVDTSLPSAYQYMQQNKLLLEAMDAEQMRLMVSQWLQMEGHLEARISDLAQHVTSMRAAGEAVTHETLMTIERYQKLLAQTQKELYGYTEFAERLISEQQAKLAKMGIEHASTAIQMSLFESGPGVGAFFDKLPVSAIENMVGLTAKGSPVAEVLAKHWPNAVQNMTDILVRNTGLGINPRQTAREMADGLAAEGLNNAMTIARSEQLRVYREASRQQYQASGMVQQYERMCAHQPRTCMACLALDGEIYDTEDLIETHACCRCIMRPIVDGMPSIERETGQDWFEKQPEHVQREMMGPSRYEMYKSGDVGIKDMVVTGTHPDWGPTASVRSVRDLQEGAGIVVSNSVTTNSSMNAVARARVDGNIEINPRQYHSLSSEGKREAMAHELGHITVEDTILKDSVSGGLWDQGEEVLRYRYNEQTQRWLYHGGETRFGEALSDSVALWLLGDKFPTATRTEQTAINKFMVKSSSQAGYSKKNLLQMLSDFLVKAERVK